MAEENASSNKGQSHGYFNSYLRWVMECQRDNAEVFQHTVNLCLFLNFLIS